MTNHRNRSLTGDVIGGIVAVVLSLGILSALAVPVYLVLGKLLGWY